MWMTFKIAGLLLITVGGPALGQAPLGINYQGVARNSDGSPIANTDIGIRISILDGGVNGLSQYREEHLLETNQFGLFSLVIGQGVTAESLSDVDWQSGSKWIQIELDPNGGSAYIVIGAQQIFSVPYALYAEESGAGLQSGNGILISAGFVTNTAPDQTISITGAGATSVTGNYPDFVVTSTDEVNDADYDPTNENLVSAQLLPGNVLRLVDGGGTYDVDLSSLTGVDPDLLTVLTKGNDAGGLTITGLSDPLTSQDVATKSYVDALNIEDSDADPGNELQTLNLNGNELELSGSPVTVNLSQYLDNSDNQTATDVEVIPTANLSSSNVQLALEELQMEVDLDADTDPANEIQNLSSSSSGTDRILTISGGLGTTIDISDDDSDASNELQILTRSGSDLTLSNGGGVVSIEDADADPANEMQDLSSSATGTNRTLNISGGLGTTIDVADNDNSASNELQVLTQAGNNVTLSNGGGSISVDDGDSDSANELQTLNQVGNNVTLSNGGGVINVDDGDSNSSNEIQNLSSSATGTNRTINITGGTGTTIDISDDDNDISNELQTLSQTGNTVTLSNGGGAISVDDGDSNSSNEFQTLSQIGNNVTLSNGGGVISVDDGDSNPANEIQGLANVLGQSNSASGATITGLGDPVNPTDAVNLQFLEATDNADYAFKVPIFFSSLGANFSFDLTPGIGGFDEGGLISTTTINIAEQGTYHFTVKGSSNLVGSATLLISINSVDEPVSKIGTSSYFDTFLYQLNSGDVVELKAVSAGGNPEDFTLTFFGFKI